MTTLHLPSASPPRLSALDPNAQRGHALWSEAGFAADPTRHTTLGAPAPLGASPAHPRTVRPMRPERLSFCPVSNLRRGFALRPPAQSDRFLAMRRAGAGPSGAASRPSRPAEPRQSQAVAPHAPSKQVRACVRARAHGIEGERGARNRRTHAGGRAALRSVS
eukprot:3103789-Pleurochrysis_carterae.AAC.1